MFKRCLSFLLIFVCIFSFIPAVGASADTTGSEQQVVSRGGENWDDYLYISKTIAGTDIENVFDITLNVVTQSRIENLFLIPSTDIVFVLDVSNTMNTKMSKDTISRYQGALSAAEQFLADFHSQAQKTDLMMDGAKLKAGFVAFNTDANMIFDLTDMGSITNINKFFKEEIEEETDAILAKYKTSDNYHYNKRYTNIQGGLRMADQMLSKSTARNKYIILLTDGFPTTYCNENANHSEDTIVGYAPYYSGSSRQDADGIFANRKLNKACSDGTSYSDRAATKAQDEANKIKNSGTKIFSIGVDIGGQTIQKYIDDAAYVVDCYSSGDYVIGSPTSESSYKNWLGNNIASGKDEGYYYDSNSGDTLTDAFDRIFITIENELKEQVDAVWTLVDPMGDTHDSMHVEFISLYDKNGDFAANPISLTGRLGEGHENTVTVENETIHWDFKHSGYTSMAANNTTSYSYSLTYRVRLKNESASFAANEGKTLVTNGETTLTYIHTLNEDSHKHDINFEIPSVKGWLGEFSFTKTDGSTSNNQPLQGAEFELSHRADCSVCKAMYPGGWDVKIESFTAVSDNAGLVSFSNIPSGHEYTLTETKAPAGYKTAGTSWPVTVAYDKTTVNGDPEFENIKNYKYGQISVTKEISGAHSKSDFDSGAFTILLKDESDTIVGQVSLPQPVPGGGLSWSHSFSDLPAGRYTLLETKASTIKDGYICYPEYIYPDGSCIELGWGETSSGTVRNYYEYKPDNITVNVEKNWYDADNRDGIRPQSIEFCLMVDGKEVQRKTAGASNDFKVSFEFDAAYKAVRVEVYECGYTDDEGQYHKLEKGENVPGYTSSLTGSISDDDKTHNYSFWNTHLPETLSIPVRKEWTEEGLQNQTAVTFLLLADDEEINSVTLDGSTGWSYVFRKDRNGNDLYKYSADGTGREIVYSVEEQSLGEYWTVTPSVDEDGTLVFTNDYHVPQSAELTLTAKKYYDNKPARGSSYTFLLSDAEGNVLQTVKNKGENVVFEPLVFSEEGRYVYTVSEKKGSSSTVKYDTSHYTVTVDVSLDRDYKIEVSTALGEKEITDGMAFFNRTQTSPPTGDNSHLMLFVAIMLISAVAAAGTYLLIRKKKK